MSAENEKVNVKQASTHNDVVQDSVPGNPQCGNEHEGSCGNLGPEPAAVPMAELASEPVNATSNESTEIPSNVADRKVYISNLNYGTSEQELLTLFKDYGVTSVLIPSHTVRVFRSKQTRPMGIAYAEFESAELASKAITDLNGIQFNDRSLRLKKHIPFDPKKAGLTKTYSKIYNLKKYTTNKIVGHVRMRFDNANNSNSEADANNQLNNADQENQPALNSTQVNANTSNNDTILVGEASEQPPQESSESNGNENIVGGSPVNMKRKSKPKSYWKRDKRANRDEATTNNNDRTDINAVARSAVLDGAPSNTNGETSAANPDSENCPASTSNSTPVSKDTLYCAYLPKSTTDKDIRYFFKDYRPQEVWMFRTRNVRARRFPLHRHRFRPMTAALVTIDSATPIEEVAKRLSDKPFIIGGITDTAGSTSQNENIIGKSARRSTVMNKIRPSTIIVKPAFLSKIEEVKKAAREASIIQQDVTDVLEEEGVPTTTVLDGEHPPAQDVIESRIEPGAMTEAFGGIQIETREVASDVSSTQASVALENNNASNNIANNHAVTVCN